MNPEDKIKKLIEESKIKTDSHTEKKILGDSLEHLEKLKQQKSPLYRLNIWEIIIKNSFVKLTAAAVLIIVVLSGLHMIGGSGIAWADVVEKFKSVDFFSAVFYEKEDALAQPEQIELWMGQSGSARVRIGSQVIFGKNGKITDAFDVTTRKKVEAENRAERMLEMLGTINGQFSLDTVLKVIARGSLTEVTPLINSDAIISEDLVVFDSQLYETQWMRIWALRESKLPVHIRIWNSRDGSCLDAFMNYSRKQPDEFFDPNKFEEVLSQTDERNKTNIAYALLTDPGGKDITPKDMFNKSGYHMPVVKQAGITKEGAFWVIADKSRNRMPNDYEVHGFSKLEDNLGRTYFSVGGGYGLDGETSYDIFVPIDFPFDQRRPTRVTLTCDTSHYNINNPELIGTLYLTQWQQDATYPNESEYSNLLSWKIELAYKLYPEEYADKLNRLVESIPHWSEQPENMRILQFWMRIANHNKDYEETVKIGQVLTPILFEEPKGKTRYRFDEYLTALAKTGRIDEVAELFSRISAEEDFSPKKSDTELYKHFLTFAAGQLAMNADLELEQINKIMGFDITKRDGYENAVQSATMNKRRRTSEKRRSEIADYYQSHPLPDKMELLKRVDNESVYLVGVPNTVPDHEDYIIQPSNIKISGHVSNLRVFGDIEPYDLIQMRVEDETAEQELYADLIYKEGTSKLEQTQFVLNQFGMELVIEEGPARKVLVAKYNGQPLKDFKEVKAPLRYDNTKDLKAGMMVTMSSNGFSLSALLSHLARQQNTGIEENDKKLVIFNDTGIGYEYGSVSLERAAWPGAEGLELAKKWFEEQFGITFTEETRAMKTYVIRKKEN